MPKAELEPVSSQIQLCVNQAAYLSSHGNLSFTVLGKLLFFLSISAFLPILIFLNIPIDLGKILLRHTLAQPRRTALYSMQFSILAHKAQTGREPSTVHLSNVELHRHMGGAHEVCSYRQSQNVRIAALLVKDALICMALIIKQKARLKQSDPILFTSLLTSDFQRRNNRLRKSHHFRLASARGRIPPLMHRASLNDTVSYVERTRFSGALDDDQTINRHGAMEGRSSSNAVFGANRSIGDSTRAVDVGFG